MLQLTITPATGTGLTPVVLCRSDRNLAEANVRLNHTRVLEPQQLAFAAFGVIQDRQNRRNILSFDVIRGENGTQTPFKDDADALAYALKATNDYPGVGTGTLIVTGSVTSWTFTLNNAAVQTFDLNSWKGICIGQTFVINCGQITY